MAVKKKKPAVDPRIADEIWVAGMMSGSGSLTLVQTKHAAVVRYVITSSNFPGAIEKLAEISGANLHLVAPSGRNKATAKRVSLQGAALHSLMTRVWDYLSHERKVTYANLRREITSMTAGPNPYSTGDNPDNFEEEK